MERILVSENVWRGEWLLEGALFYAGALATIEILYARINSSFNL